MLFFFITKLLSVQKPKECFAWIGKNYLQRQCTWTTWWTGNVVVKSLQVFISDWAKDSRVAYSSEETKPLHEMLKRNLSSTLKSRALSPGVTKKYDRETEMFASRCAPLTVLLAISGNIWKNILFTRCKGMTLPASLFFYQVLKISHFFQSQVGESL